MKEEVDLSVDFRNQNLSCVMISWFSMDHSSQLPLDFEKIKSGLITLPERKKGLLLQALRWVSEKDY